MQEKLYSYEGFGENPAFTEGCFKAHQFTHRSRDLDLINLVIDNGSLRDAGTQHDRKDLMGRSGTEMMLAGNR